VGERLEAGVVGSRRFDRVGPLNCGDATAHDRRCELHVRGIEARLVIGAAKQEDSHAIAIDWKRERHYRANSYRRSILRPAFPKR